MSARSTASTSSSVVRHVADALEPLARELGVAIETSPARRAGAN